MWWKMQEIVDEMVENRDIRLEQQFLRLIDPRNDDNLKYFMPISSDGWSVNNLQTTTFTPLCYYTGNLQRVCHCVG
ncbi:hypothetical protein HMPREF9446_03039 [Bacteroides fluxus YIT 12057]|uniref:Uncharacterized protein n=1 Tax=Bacteroides fluxus YIT 12057 TaxID=763034 RepID=F3PWA4_9BACE|nr:hypothetical protein HMPREF9446_03039 [Bacteroides fluxus YIT 12057]